MMLSSFIFRLVSICGRRCIISGLSLSALSVALLLYHRHKRNREADEARLNFPDLSNGDTLVGKVLTEELWNELFYKKTSTGFSIEQAIHIGKIVLQ